MQTISQIFTVSFKSTSRTPRWWIFAFFQIVFFAVISSLLKPKIFFSPNVFWLISASLILQPVTIGLWLEIEAVNLKQQKNIALKNFLKKYLGCLGLTLFSIALIILVRFAYPVWTVTSVFSSLVAATGVLAALYIVICDQSFVSAWALAFDTWNKKFSLALMAALVILVGHAAAFSFARLFLSGFINKEVSFASLNHSATIWILLVSTGFILAFFAAVANAFLVLLFLNIIERKKDPEAEQRSARDLVAASTTA